MASRKPRSQIAAGPSQRQLRVGEEMRHALVEIFRRGGLRDPALRDVNLTVTEVRMAPDLKHATAFVTPLGGGDATAALEGLRRGTGFLRTALARAVRLRVAPSLDFELDDSFDRVGRIEALLRRPEVARDLDQDGSDDGA